MERHLILQISGAGIALAILTSASVSLGTKTYYADEGLTYNGNGCQNNNLVSDIGSMLSNMNNDGYPSSQPRS